jgi:hypothetical protein
MINKLSLYRAKWQDGYCIIIGNVCEHIDSAIILTSISVLTAGIEENHETLQSRVVSLWVYILTWGLVNKTEG